MTTVSNQYTSPSHAFAQHVVTTLRAERSQQRGRPESVTIRCLTRIKAQLLQDCEKILERSSTLRTEFNKIATPMKDLKHLQIIRAYEKELYMKMEVEGSLGWNYLYDENWRIIEKELGRVFDKGSSLISTRGSPHIASGFGVDSIWKGIDPKLSRLDKLLPQAAGHKRLTLPLPVREEILSKTLEKIAGLSSSDRQAVKNAYGSRLESLVQWAVIIQCLKCAVRAPDNATIALRELARMTAMSDRDLLEEIKKPIGELPVYNASSLRCHCRIGLRQAALRPELKTHGFARHGGLYM